MTICIFSAQYLPTVGGVERYTYNLARCLIAEGHKVIVATSALRNLPAEEVSSEGIHIYRLPAALFMKGRFPVLKPGRAFQQVAANLWKESIDFCVIHTRFYVSSMYAARQCKKRQIPAIVIDHSTGHLPMNNPILNLAGAAYEHMAAGIIKRYCNNFYGVSRAVSQWLSHFGIAAKGQVYNAVQPEDVLALANAADAVNWRDKLGLAPDTKLVAFVGRIIVEKGVRELMDAFVLAAVPGTALVIAGDGPLLAALKENCPPQVYLVGSTPYPEAMQLMAQSQLYCLPTYYAEGFPTTFLEAAACGCPIVTTRTGGSDELLPDESYGIQLDSAAVAPLAAALKKALCNEEWRQTAAQKTARLLSEHFTWQAVTAHLLTLADQLTS